MSKSYFSVLQLSPVHTHPGPPVSRKASYVVVQVYFQSRKQPENIHTNIHSLSPFARPGILMMLQVGTDTSTKLLINQVGQLVLPVLGGNSSLFPLGSVGPRLPMSRPGEMSYCCSFQNTLSSGSFSPINHAGSDTPVRETCKGRGELVQEAPHGSFCCIAPGHSLAAALQIMVGKPFTASVLPEAQDRLIHRCFRKNTGMLLTLQHELERGSASILSKISLRKYRFIFHQI